MESCPACGALPCDWVDKERENLKERIVELEKALLPVYNAICRSVIHNIDGESMKRILISDSGEKRIRLALRK